MLTAIVAGVISAFTASAQPGPPHFLTGPAGAPSALGRDVASMGARNVAETHAKEGVFQSAYPSKEWQEVPCAAAPPQPYRRRRGASGLNSWATAQIM